MRPNSLATMLGQYKAMGEISALLQVVHSDEFKAIIDEMNAEGMVFGVDDVFNVSPKEAESLLFTMNLLAGLRMLVEDHPEARVIYPESYWNAFLKYEANIRTYSYFLGKVMDNPNVDRKAVMTRNVMAVQSIAINWKKAF